jgi:hypothetical protein
MSDFERIHQIDPQREKKIQFEKHISFEKSHEILPKRITDIENSPPLIPMKIEAPLLEEQIKKLGMNRDEKSARKTPKKKAKRNHA